MLNEKASSNFDPNYVTYLLKCYQCTKNSEMCMTLTCTHWHSKTIIITRIFFAMQNNVFLSPKATYLIIGRTHLRVDMASQCVRSYTVLHPNNLSYYIWILSSSNLLHLFFWRRTCYLLLIIVVDNELTSIACLSVVPFFSCFWATNLTKLTWK